MTEREEGQAPPALAVGQLRRQVMLETEAVYRVAELATDNVVVEVVRAPGLEPGGRFEVTREAAARMELIDGPGALG